MGIATVIPALAPTPVMNLPAIIKPLDRPTGHRAFHRMNQAFANSHTRLRPLISDQAAMGKGPTARPRKYVEKVICAVVASMPRSRSMSPSAAAIMLADMSVTSCPKEKTRPMLILRRDGQL